MSTVRQDAWTQDEDLLLAEVVLRYIREGGTQLTAFEEVGKKLSRTSAACGFRWNSYVRKQYGAGIELAKKQRKELKKEQAIQQYLPVDEKYSSIDNKLYATDNLTISAVISYLNHLEQLENEYSKIKEENQGLKSKVDTLEKELKMLAEAKLELESSMNLVEEDYRALIEIMERARKMVVLQDEDKNKKVKFQMDRNGNLERVEK
ncbi:RsfA family transcriptional regulator [Sutcliffiella rhizosphaerae]|uniref:Prespore-specific transcriptional regulator RsfA n=1 Tax=Sutcliffiella rhizosphaerae TaxID=2880967 RepID=A0ABM8YIW9_9BACI|nr:RsfA family transcriptional regulator [Sutcliffiella rhizosphaerae]CAG9619821.1 Prespore-specific transcriptional regulator RsfA [Sutcliffiella rhizosphaerae]